MFLPLSICKLIKLYFKGTKGGAGGRCGFGGNGGNGGNGGKKIMIILQQNSTTETSQNGDSGENGKPGKPGIGALYEVIETHGLTQVFSRITGDDENLIHEIQIKSTQKAQNGAENSACLSMPKLMPKVNEIKFYERGTEYLRFSIELDTKYKYGKLFAMSDFYKNLLENKYFEANIEDLIERVELFKKPEYHHLLESLIHIIQNYNNKNNPTEEDKLVLNYLLATISGIIIRKNIATQTTLESDLEKYLEDLVKDIQKWKGFKTSEIIHKIKTSREKSLKIEIEKASLIINKLEKSIESSEKILNKNFDDSLKEILKIKNSLLEEDKNLVKSKDDLQNNLKLKKFFSGLKIASKLLSVLGPKGAIIGSVAHAAHHWFSTNG